MLYRTVLLTSAGKISICISRFHGYSTRRCFVFSFLAHLPPGGATRRPYVNEREASRVRAHACSFVLRSRTPLSGLLHPLLLRVRFLTMPWHAAHHGHGPGGSRTRGSSPPAGSVLCRLLCTARGVCRLRAHRAAPPVGCRHHAWGSFFPALAANTQRVRVWCEEVCRRHPHHRDCGPV